MASRRVISRFFSRQVLMWICLLFLLGCDKAQILRIYNNSGRGGAIQLGGPAWGLKRPFPVEKEAELGAVFFKWPVYVYLDQETWLYEDVGGLGWSPAWWVRNDPAKYQIEPNGALFYIPTELEMPARELPKQPEGYPKFPFRKKTGRN